MKFAIKLVLVLIVGLILSFHLFAQPNGLHDDKGNSGQFEAYVLVAIGGVGHRHDSPGG